MNSTFSPGRDTRPASATCLPGGLNGRQVADAGRVSRPGLKVLFITGYAESAAVGNGLLDEGMEVVTKPFAMGELVGKVKGLVERGS